MGRSTVATFTQQLFCQSLLDYTNRLDSIGKYKVSGKPAKRPKHIPQRTCVGCHTVLPKRTLIRLVRRPEGVRIDPTGKLAGRGAYLHNRVSCWENGLKGPLARALKITLASEEIEVLRQFTLTLPEENKNEGADQ